MSVFELVIRLLAIVSVLLIMARINGPKQVSQMNFYDYVVGITVGSVAATVTLNKTSFETGCESQNTVACNEALISLDRNNPQI